MSLNGLTNPQFPLTIDGTSNLNTDSLTVDGTTISTDTLVPYTGAKHTLNMGSYEVQTSSAPTALTSLTNKNYVDAADANLQTQINNKVSKSGDTMSGNLTVPSLTVSGATGSKVPIFDVSKNLVSSGVDSIKITYLDNVSSDIQTQLNTKATTTYVDAADANLQTQINARATIAYVDAADAVLQSGINARVNRSGDTMTGALTVPTLYVSGATADKVAFFDGTKSLASSSITSTELGYLSGASSNLQTQINAKASTSYVDTQDANLQSQINTKASITYVDTQDALRVPYTGATTTVNLGTQKIQSSTAPSTGNDLVNKTYADGLVSGYVPYTGATTTLNLGAQKAQSSTAPTTGNDLTNKTYVDGVDSSLQTQINGKVSKSGDTMTGLLTVPSFNVSGATSSTVAVFDASKNLTSSTVSTTTLGYLDATSSVQTQLNSKASTTYVDSADVVLQNQINARATTSYVDTSVATRVPYTGATTLVNLGTQKIQSSTAPSTGNDLCNKTYVDSIAGGNITPNNNYWTGENYFQYLFNLGYGVIANSFAGQGQTASSFTAVSGTISGAYTLTFPTGQAIGTMKLTSYSFSNPYRRYRFTFTMTASTLTALVIYQNGAPISNGTYAINTGAAQTITGFFNVPAGITYDTLFRFSSLITGSNVSWTSFTLEEIDLSIPIIDGGTNILNGNLAIGTAGASSSLKLLTYDAGATGWKGMVYFGNDNVGMVAGAYNNVVYIGGHTRALNAWSDIYLAPGGRVGVGMSGSRAPVSQFEIAGAAFNPLTLTRTGASTNFGVGTVHSLIDATNTFQAYYARTIGGSNGTIATTNQNQANGYYAIDLANAGVFGSDSNPFSSTFYLTSSLLNTNTKVNIFSSSTTDTTVCIDGDIAIQGTPRPLLKLGKDKYSGFGDFYGIGFGWCPNPSDYSPAEIGLVSQSVAGYTYGDLVFRVRTLTTNTQAPERMRIMNNGNVGIGTFSATTVLQLAKSVSVNNDYSLMLSYQNTNAGYFDWQIGPYIDSGQAMFGIRGDADGFGSLRTIYKYTADSNFQIVGQASTGGGKVEFYQPDGTRLMYIGCPNSVSSTAYLTVEAARHLSIQTNGVERIWLKSNGKIAMGMDTGLSPTIGLGSGHIVMAVGQGIWNASAWNDGAGVNITDNASGPNCNALSLGQNFALDYSYISSLTPGLYWRQLVIAASYTSVCWFGAQCAYTTAGGWVNTSDRRCKKDIEDLKTSRSLERVLKCRPKRYKRVFTDEKVPVPDHIKETMCIGLIAQEVQEFNPHCVSEWDDRDETDETQKKKLGINYGDWTIHLIGAVQEQQKQIETLQKTVDIIVEHARSQEKRDKEQDEEIKALTLLLAEERQKRLELEAQTEERFNKMAALIQQLLPQ